MNFIHVAGPEIMDRYVGESEEAVRELFERARQTAPSIIFLDEIDAIASHRGQGNEVTERVVSQLLAELDGITENPNLVVLAATNRRDMIDDALLRPGRLEQHVEVPNPDREAREEILAVHTDGKPLADDTDMRDLAEETDGFSGAELEPSSAKRRCWPSVRWRPPTGRKRPPRTPTKWRSRQNTSVKRWSGNGRGSSQDIFVAVAAEWTF